MKAATPLIFIRDSYTVGEVMNTVKILAVPVDIVDRILENL